jgi:hypothetical protein
MIVSSIGLSANVSITLVQARWDHRLNFGPFLKRRAIVGVGAIDYLTYRGTLLAAG